MTAKISVNVRMYRLNELGDSFLLTFTNGDQKSYMLIDCGSFRNGEDSTARLQQITADIKEQLKGQPLDVVVGTHQHNDHVSGFVHCKDTFRSIGVEEVWLSWLDNPQDGMARDIGEAHNNLKLQLTTVHDRLQAIAKGARTMRTMEILDDILGFYGSKGANGPPELPADAVRILKTIGRKKPKYLKPGRSIDIPGMPAGSVRVHVLGPPRDSDLLYRKDPRTGESYDHALASANYLAAKFLDAVNVHNDVISREEEYYPFNERYKVRDTTRGSDALKHIASGYNHSEAAWRKIDDDWLQQAETLALYMDTFTNNSSLVLAIELVESGKVLLFVGDAQTGNWLSWANVKWERTGVSTDDLLARTVFYKVGHHASHNATLVDVFEKMDHPDLVAMIPVHKKDPNVTKQNGWKMPARNLLKRIIEKTEYRVLQMDDVNPASCDPKKNPAKDAWKKVGIKPKVTDMFIEVEIS